MSAAPSKPVPTPGESCILEIKAVPGAPKSEVCGTLGEAIKIKVKAPAVEGKANEALLRFLSDTLDIPMRSLMLVKGDCSRFKRVKLTGLSLAEAQRRLLGAK